MKQTIEFDKDANEIEVTLPDGTKVIWTNEKISRLAILNLVLSANKNVSISQEHLYTPNDVHTIIYRLQEAPDSSEENKEKVIPENILSLSVDTLIIVENGRAGLKRRVENCLRSAEIRTIKDLIDQKDELWQKRNFGKKSILAIKAALAKLGYDVEFQLSY